MSSTTASEIKWEAPPAKRGGSGSAGRMAAFVEVLKTRPNEWAVYAEGITNSVVVSTAPKRYPQTQWTGRKQANGKWTIYARYIG